MTTYAPASGDDSIRYLKVIAEGVQVRRHLELLNWLQGDFQRFLPHDILLAAWGNFEEGSITHDVVSALPEVRSYASGTEVLPFLLSRLHGHWTARGRMPCSVGFEAFVHLLGSASLPASFCSAMRTMKWAHLHGFRDARGRHDSLYVFLSSAETMAGPTGHAAAVLLPFVDAALRQMTPLPQQQRDPSASAPARSAADDATAGLSEREAQIMAWVAMGKTNSEIGSILHISGYTVKNHMQRIFQKLNVFNRTQAVSKVTRMTVNG
ncbi:MAG: helix-turn-helix transcriptional regulator [Polaromonas sp.]|nr:helix-turn-helix transcriptional regulator [Polaromonas sp.]